MDCILCEIVSGSELVTCLEVHRTERLLVSLNKYPYNPGHLIVFPIRHLEDPAGLEPEEVLELHQVQLLSMEVLRTLYHPGGFNVGFNLGPASGASIAHLHLHLVPRYQRELGFMDIIGGAKITVEDPHVSRERLHEAFVNLSRGEPIDGP